MEAAVKKADKATKAAEAAQELAEKSLADAEAYLHELSSKGGSGQGAIWWMERELHEVYFFFFFSFVLLLLLFLLLLHLSPPQISILFLNYSRLANTCQLQRVESPKNKNLLRLFEIR